MRITDQLLGRMKSRMTHYNFSAAGLAAHADISQPTLSRIFNKNFDSITDDTAQKLSSALGIPLDDMWELSQGRDPSKPIPGNPGAHPYTPDTTLTPEIAAVFEFFSDPSKYPVLKEFAKVCGMKDLDDSPADEA